MDFSFYNTLEHESDIREGDENSTFDRVAGMNVFLPHQRLKSLDGFGLEFFLQLQKKSVRGTASELPEVDVELVAVNGFKQVMKFLKKITELCSKNNSNLIIRTDLRKLKKKQLATIEKVIAPYSKKINKS